MAPAASAVDATACFVARADLQVVKVAPAQVQAGEAVTYDITVTNNGPFVSSGWTVTDTLPAGLRNPATSSPGCQILNGQLSCTGGKLPVGDSAAITVTGTAPQPGGATLDNVVSVAGNDPDPKPENNTSAVATNVVTVPLIDSSVGAATATAVSTIGIGFMRRWRRSASRTAM